MDAEEGQQGFHGKKITKQLTGKRDDSPLHSAARRGDLEVVLGTFTDSRDEELKELLSRQNQSGETALYVAAECGYTDLVREMLKYCDIEVAGIKAKNGCDACHIASKHGHLDVLKVLMESFPELAMTSDQSNTTALHSAASQGHVEIVNFLLEKNSGLATIARSNNKTVLHSSARNGHLEVVKALLSKQPSILTRNDKKGQTALHMAVKGQNIEVVDELISTDASLINMVDGKGNTALHIAVRKCRTEFVQALLSHEGINKEVINKSGETALDTAAKTSQPGIATILREHGVRSAKTMRPPPMTNTARELRQTVSDIRHEVHDQLEHTRQTQKGVKGLKKGVKMYARGLNNAINSSTVVAILIASVAFAAIYQLPGQNVDDPKKIPRGFSLGEGHIAPNPEFIIFFLFDSLALFISLAVVVVQTSVVVVERKAKKQMMAIINKLMWLACAFVSVAFLSLSYVVVGKDQRLLAIGVTVIGTVIMASTLGVLLYWVIMNRIEASNSRKIRKSARSSKDQSWAVSAVMSDSDILDDEHRNLYAI